MGKYDMVDQTYFADRERVAELVSVGIYHKKLRLKGEDLEYAEGKYPVPAGGPGSLERDGLFLCAGHRVKYGLEIENYADYGMPKRIMIYDACEYEKQALELDREHGRKRDLKGFEEIKSKMKTSEHFTPVINMLLYLGNGHWRGRSAMREMFDLPEKWKAFLHDKIQNYAFTIIEADHVNPMDFQTDLRQFFQAMQCRRDREKLKELFQRPEFRNLNMETQRVIAIHLNHKKLMKKVIEENVDMCKALNDWAKEERAIGRKEGISQGIIRGSNLTIACLRMLKEGKSKEDLIKAGYEKGIVEELALLL